jgi:thiol-disulfide isomerase/thioredoxin
MLRYRSALFAGFGICLLGLLGLAVARTLPAEEPKPTDKPSTVSLKIANWEEAQEIVKKHKGKIVVMDVWSTSCDPCMKEFPNLVKLHKTLGKDVACMSVSTDYAGSKNKPPEYYKERVLKFLQEQDASFDNVLLNVPSDELFEKIELSSIPAVYVYGRDGKLVKRFDSESAENLKTDEEAFTYADVNKVVQGLLKAKKK